MKKPSEGSSPFYCLSKISCRELDIQLQVVTSQALSYDCRIKMGAFEKGRIFVQKTAHCYTVKKRSKGKSGPKLHSLSR